MKTETQVSSVEVLIRSEIVLYDLVLLNFSYRGDSFDFRGIAHAKEKANARWEKFCLSI